MRKIRRRHSSTRSNLIIQYVCIEKDNTGNLEQRNLNLFIQKGDKTIVKHYRPISRFSQFYKLLIRITTIKITKKRDEYQLVEQVAFRKGFGTYD